MPTVILLALVAYPPLTGCLTARSQLIEVNSSPPPPSMNGFALSEEQTEFRIDEYLKNNRQSSGVAKIAVYGEESELFIISTGQSLTNSQVEAELRQSASMNDGSEVRSVQDGGCVDTVSMQDDAGINCILTRDGNSVSIMLSGVDEAATLSVADDVLDDWW